MYVSIHLSMRTCIQLKIGRLVYLWSADTYLYMRARASVGAYTLHTHTHARTHAAPRRLYVCARANARMWSISGRPYAPFDL